MMNGTHLHLLSNHIPVLGAVGGLGLLAFALWRRSGELTRVALGALVLAAAVAIPVYLTGEPAERGVRGLPGVSFALIEQHEKVASGALGGLLAVGVLALLGLVWFRGARLIPVWFGLVTLAGAVIVSGLMGWTASLGGQVRHSEIRAGSSQPAQLANDHD